MKGRHNVQLWVQLQVFPEGDRLSREEEYPYEDEDDFIELVDEELQKWIGKHKDFGIKEYGWKLIETT